VICDGQSGTTGGAGGPTVTVSTYSALVSAVGDHSPRVVQVSGTISGPGPLVDVGSNKTIVGLSGATLSGFGLNISGWRAEQVAQFRRDWCEAEHAGQFTYTKNVIVRNLTFTGYPDDGINVACWSHHIWIHHNTFLAGTDGALDIKRGSNWVTVAWNKFVGTDKTMLLGHDDSNGAQDRGKLNVTYHHNWFQNTVQRHPRVRFGKAHVYNNYGENIQNYFIGSSLESDIYADGNYLDINGYPTQEQGSASGKLTWHSSNLVVRGKAVEVNTGNAFLPTTYYGYALDPASSVPSIVRANAGAR
jgi:pectate lyase